MFVFSVCDSVLGCSLFLCVSVGVAIRIFCKLPEAAVLQLITSGVTYFFFSISSSQFRYCSLFLACPATMFPLCLWSPVTVSPDKFHCPSACCHLSFAACLPLISTLFCHPVQIVNSWSLVLTRLISNFEIMKRSKCVFERKQHCAVQW